MRTVVAALDELSAALAVAGFLPATDIEQLSPLPGAVLLVPQSITATTRDMGELTVWLLLCSPTTDADATLTLLDDGLSGLLGLSLELADDGIDLTAAVLTPANPTTPRPAWRLAVTLDL